MSILVRAILPAVLAAAGCASPGLAAPQDPAPRPSREAAPPSHASVARPTPPPDPTAAPPPATRPAPTPAVEPAYDLHVLDVGTGLSVFVTGPSWSLLYDAGSNDDLATGTQNRVVAYLKALRPELATIDHAILSHAHRDHDSLFEGVFAAYRVKAAWDPGAVNPACDYRTFVQSIADDPRIAYRTAAHDEGTVTVDFGRPVCTQKLPAKVDVAHGARLEPGERVRLDEHASMTVLHVSAVARAGDYNRTSIVVLLELGGARVLLMGDAEAGGRASPSRRPTPSSIEGTLLATRRDDLRADVLVVGHHGSKSSTREAFLAAVRPRVAVVSAGPTKYHGVVLPDREVMDLLHREVPEVLETDLDDEACARNPRKIGPDADGRPGGCDAVSVHLAQGKAIAAYFRGAD